MTSETPPLASVDTFAGAAASWLKNPFLGFLAIIFALAQLYVLGVLPAVQNTLKTKTMMQKNVVAIATAKNAQLREQAEADAKTQEAIVNAEKAAHSARRAAATARKTDAEAKRDAAIATNSPELQKALAAIATQEANIKAEQAKHEQRKAAAVALKGQYEAEKLRAEADVGNANAVNRAVMTRIESIIACATEIMVRNANAKNFAQTGKPILPSIFDRDFKQKQYDIFRSNCLTPAKEMPAEEKAKILPTLTKQCTGHLASWRKAPNSHAAFAVGTDGGCGWSFSRNSLELAQSVALEQCRESHNGCLVIEQK